MPPALHNPKFDLCERALLDECAAHSGSAISVLNSGHANFATTYRTAFLVAASDLFRLYSGHQIADPAQRMSEEFTNRNIYSCRGAEMTLPRVKYLLNTKIRPIVKTLEYEILNQLVKQECPVCGKYTFDADAHIKAAHPTLEDGR